MEDGGKMYHAQKGCLPSLISTLSVILFLIIGTDVIARTYHIWNTVTVGQMNFNEAMWKIIENLGVSMILLSVFMPWVLLLGGMFPSIRLTKGGLKYNFLGFLGGEIKWSEIDDIVDLKWPQKYKAVIIMRRGFFLVNGLWLRTMYGVIFMGLPEPLLIISPKIRERDLILDEIHRHRDS